MNKILGKIFVWGFCAFAYFLHLLPHRIFLFFVDGLSWILRLVDRRRYKDVMSNLTFVYQQTKSLEEKQAIIKRCYRNFSFLLLESARALYTPREKLLEKFQYHNLEALTNLVEQEKSIVLISGHFGYWEAIASSIPHFAPNYGKYSLGRLTQFQAVNELIIRSRENYGVKLIDKKGSFKQILKIYSKPKQIVGIIVDQNMSESEAVWVKFFGKDVTHTPVASILSRRFDIPILPVFIDFNEDYTQFIVRFMDPFYCPNTQNMENDILEATQKQASLMQDMIEHHPSSWLWFHKRFKAKYPQIYSKQHS